MLVIAVGQRMPPWVDQAFAEYAKRMPPELKLDLREIKSSGRAGVTTAHALAQEAERIRQTLPRRATVVVLDEHGDDLTSAQLARARERWRALGEPIAFVIGSADGLDGSIKAAATDTLRLSSLTLPHGLARVLLAEQLYRAHTLLAGHPYHRT